MIFKDAEFNAHRLFWKSIHKGPKTECSLGTYIFKKKTKEKNRQAFWFSDIKVNIKKGGDQAASLCDLGTEAVSFPSLNAKASLSFYFIKDQCSKVCQNTSRKADSYKRWIYISYMRLLFV